MSVGWVGLGWVGGVTTEKDCVLSRDNLFASVRPFYAPTNRGKCVIAKLMLWAIWLADRREVQFCPFVTRDGL